MPTSLFSHQKLAPKYLIDLHDDYTRKKITFKEYKRLEKAFVKKFYAKRK